MDTLLFLATIVGSIFATIGVVYKIVEPIRTRLRRQRDSLAWFTTDLFKCTVDMESLQNSVDKLGTKGLRVAQIDLNMAAVSLSDRLELHALARDAYSHVARINRCLEELDGFLKTNPDPVKRASYFSETYRPAVESAIRECNEVIGRLLKEIRPQLQNELRRSGSL